jgi:L,D-transpeptidase catalytic domain
LASGLAVLAVALACAPAAASGAASSSAAPNPATAHVKLTLHDLFAIHRQAVTVPGRKLVIRGEIRPYAPEQWVTVQAFLHGRPFKTAVFRLARSPGGGAGVFIETLASPGAGAVTVKVTHRTTSRLAAFSASQHFIALNDRVSFGATGWFVQLLQQRLATLHFYIPQTGVYDQGTGLAIDAYHRLLRWGTYQTLDAGTIKWLLNGWGRFPVRFPSHGPHAEGNLGLQLLALANGSRVQSIYPISSGKPSTPTILGDFRVYSKVPGYLPDGMYFSNFFFGGYAIHGYDPAPDYPASHGCMRVPISDAISIFNWLGYGDWVDVYY